MDSKESIIYSMDWKAPPLTFTDEETGRDEGLLVDYMLALSIELGIDVEFDAVPFNEVMDSLDSGRADFIKLAIFAMLASFLAMRAIFKNSST